ncbi:hypothetical protein [Salinibacillus xinjiangensis]|uniref:Uncharacterized protein n=1 Tax=Salinibacillus xinjiangensis TaxID=1229268 RepID=A0A6G1X5T0_9BACI|nr:hypothetical protein [Salinibacillus xinjiangensis]MRG86265.1 hypothetical protein [Salinibacillus xinjiangensis]
MNTKFDFENLVEEFEGKLGRKLNQQETEFLYSIFLRYLEEYGGNQRKAK